MSEHPIDERSKTPCHLCGGYPRDYVVLNRWVAASGGMGAMQSGPGAYRWKPRDASCSGYLLCVDGCLLQWVEGAVVEVRAEARKADAD